MNRIVGEEMHYISIGKHFLNINCNKRNCTFTVEFAFVVNNGMEIPKKRAEKHDPYFLDQITDI